ncbi:MAG TPA: hypothetical protein VHM66_00055, partial [Solirubrobacterales bacterium]|nr:hypothetical protein [Solirubrobacterales bacterium]
LIGLLFGDRGAEAGEEFAVGRHERMFASRSRLRSSRIDEVHVVLPVEIDAGSDRDDPLPRRIAVDICDQDLELSEMVLVADAEDPPEPFEDRVGYSARLLDFHENPCLGSHSDDPPFSSLLPASVCLYPTRLPQKTAIQVSWRIGTLTIAPEQA